MVAAPLQPAVAAPPPLQLAVAAPPPLQLAVAPAPLQPAVAQFQFLNKDIDNI